MRCKGIPGICRAGTIGMEGMLKGWIPPCSAGLLALVACPSVAHGPGTFHTGPVRGNTAPHAAENMPRSASCDLRPRRDFARAF